MKVAKMKMMCALFLVGGLGCAFYLFIRAPRT